MMLRVDAGGVSRDSVLLATAPGLTPSLKRKLFSLVHPLNVNRFRRLFVIVHGAKSFLC